MEFNYTDLENIKNSFGRCLITLACSKDKDPKQIIEFIDEELKEARLIKDEDIKINKINNLLNIKELFFRMGGNKENGCIIFSSYKMIRGFDRFTQPMITNLYKCDYNFENSLIDIYLDD